MADKVDPRAGEATTTNYGWTKPTVGASVDAWGGYINTDLDGIDSTVKSVSTVANAASASLSNYLPLIGGTMTGGLTLNFASPSLALTATASGQARQIVGSTGSQIRWVIQLGNGGAETGGSIGSDFALISYNDAQTPTVPFSISRASGSAIFGARLDAGTGFGGRAGNAGAVLGNVFNIAYPGPNLWIDATNFGTIAFTSDYRIKKDVAPLASTWERVRALNPISYTQADYHPTNAEPAKEGEPSMFQADDIERWGFIAHELQETLIESAANGVKDDPVHIQSPNPWTVIATLTKALQEAMTRIEALEGLAR